MPEREDGWAGGEQVKGEREEERWGRAGRKRIKDGKRRRSEEGEERETGSGRGIEAGPGLPRAWQDSARLGKCL